MTPDTDASIAGRELAITGKLASMSREDAVRRIVEAGGAYVETPTARTAMLVYGQGGPPLGDDGRLTASLRKARELSAAGAAIRVVSEDEWLAVLGLETERGGLGRLYTTEQLARILKIDRRLIRSWVRHDLIRPAKVVHRLHFFDFREVATAKALSQLTGEGVTPTRIRKSLEQLAAWRGDETALAQLEVLERSTRRGGASSLGVRLEGGQVAEPSGQLRLDFDALTGTSAVPDEAAPPGGAVATPGIATPTLRAVDAPEPGAGDWIELALAAEGEERLEDAIDAYEKALDESEGNDAEALMGLGNTYYALERLAESAKAFARAVEVDPERVEAWNNLGNVLAQLGRHEDAISAYRCALSLAPDYADAHYNLAESLAQGGKVMEARKHFLAYLEQDPTSEWATEVRSMLAELSEGSPP